MKAVLLAAVVLATVFGLVPPCPPTLPQITFLQQAVRNPLENLIHSLMVEVKQGAGVVGLATMVLTHVKSTNTKVLLRMKDLRKEENKEEDCRGEVELLHEVQEKLEEIMDNAVREQMRASSLGVLANDLLKLKLEVEKLVMELMMVPETSEKVQGVCPHIRELKQKMALTTCWRNQDNEVDSGFGVPSFGRQEQHGEHVSLLENWLASSTSSLRKLARKQPLSWPS